MVSRAKAEMILKWNRDGYGVNEIARLLKISEEECRSIILHPELAERRRSRSSARSSSNRCSNKRRDPSTLSKDPWAADMERTLI